MENVDNAPVKEREEPKKKKVKFLDKIPPRVYCGPTVKGVAKQYTVFSGDVPEALVELIAAHPAAAALLVSFEKFAETRKMIEIDGSAESILYQSIESEL